MYVKVRAYPNTKKESFTKKAENHFEITVREPAERNMANTRIIEMIANEYGVPKNQVRLVTGHHSPSKILDVITK